MRGSRGAQSYQRTQELLAVFNSFSPGGSQMDKKSFAASGHLPTLFSAFLYFDVSFMVWVLFGPMTPFIADQMHLSATQKGLLTAIPLLGGSFFRPIMGLLADRIGGRRAGLTGLTLTLIPLTFGRHFARPLRPFSVMR